MEKIAVIGLSCLFPGAQNPEQFWQNLVSGQDSTSTLDRDNLGVDPNIFFNPEFEKGADTFYCLKGGFIKDFNFISGDYNLPENFVDSLDNIFKWSLCVAKQALADSGYLNQTSVLSKCGLIFGNLSAPTRLSQRLVSPLYQHTVEASLQEVLQQSTFQVQELPTEGEVSPLNMLTAAYPATVVAQALALGSTHLTIDAACSSALYTVKLASHYLQSGKADLMLAGAISCADPFQNFTAFSCLKACAEDGYSRPFDALSSGLLTSEGTGILVLKRLSDAVRDGDKIYATIRGVGLSNDGKGRHFVSPNPKGQLLAFERAYSEAQINPNEIDYVECHATGTDLGDRTELDSMDTFFGQYGAKPLVGSVKANLGHLLTAAGMPSLVKVILSMSQGQIPPSIHIREPLSSSNDVIAKEQIVQSMTPWPSQGSTKRAAISAFGFGGTNAHLVLEQYAADQAVGHPNPEVTPVGSSPLAITGMDAFFGGCDGLDAFERTLYEGKQHFIPVPPERWKGMEDDQQLLQKYGFADGKAPLGAYIKDFELDFFQFKVSPKREEQPIPRQLLMLKVADRAIRDAQLKEGGNVAVIIAMETDLSAHLYRARCDAQWQIPQGLEDAGLSLPPEKTSEIADIVKASLHTPRDVSRTISYIGNIMACRISSTWDFSGPSFTLSSGENSVFKALEVAQFMLARGEAEAVVVGAVDLAGNIENVLLRNQLIQANTGTPTLSYDAKSNGWMVGEGAGAVVLKRVDQAKQQQDKIYAVIDAVTLLQDNYTPATDSGLPQYSKAEAVAQTCQAALDQAGVSPKDIGYLEVSGSGISSEDAAEIEGLVQSYRLSTPDLTCAIGSAKANIGHTFAASGMASLIKTALCLYHRYIPATPQWTAPKQPEAFQGSPFYVAPLSTMWSLDESMPKRTAAINGVGLDGAHAHVILSEEPTQLVRHSSYLENMPLRLFPIAADTQEDLINAVKQLQHTIEESLDLAKVASETFAVFRQNTQKQYVIAFVGQTKKALIRDIERALQGIPKAIASQGEWATPQGSYFTAKPLGKTGQVGFVYSGGFTSFLGQGRETYRLFPGSYDCMSKFGATPILQKVLHRISQMVYPRSLTKLSPRQMEELELKLLDDADSMLISGTVVAIVYTMLLQDYFQLKPNAAFGYSLGELSMMYSLNVWKDVSSSISKIDSSPLFKTRLTGPKNAVREYWGLPTTDIDADKDFWSTYVLIAPVADVIEALQQEERVYLTHINTPKEVVIAGDRQGCLRVMQALQCDSIPAPGNHVLHCDPMKSEYSELVDWLTLSIQNRPNIDFYSAANYGVSQLNSEAIANNIAKAICAPLDFPRLVNQVYDSGVRIFVELGSGSTCTRWIRETLKHKDHLALPGFSRGLDTYTGILRNIAKLVSHQVTLDLSPLYRQVEQETKSRKSLIQTVTLGGSRIRSVIATPENQKRFAPYITHKRPRQEQFTDAKESPSVAKEGSATGTPHSSLSSHVHPSTSDIRRPSEQLSLRKEAEVKTSSVDNSDTLFANRQTTDVTSQVASSHRQSVATGFVSSQGTDAYTSPDSSNTPPAITMKHTSDDEQAQHDTDAEETAYSSDYYRELSESLSRKNQAHASFLHLRKESLAQMGQLIQQQIAVSQKMLATDPSSSATDLGNTSPPPSSSQPISFPQNDAANGDSSISRQPKPGDNADHAHQGQASKAKRVPANVIFDEANIVEHATGKISNVFGKDYEAIDSFPRRARVPMHPYLFMSRVTKLEATKGCFEACMIETEYDIPHDAWYAPTGYVPSAIIIEASHGNIFLASYLGADLEFQGQRSYRALGGKTTFLSELPKAGETIRCEIKAHSFFRMGGRLLFSFVHDCYVGDRLVLTMESGAGFFSAEDLKGSQGIILTTTEKEERRKIQKRHFEPLLRCEKSSFTDAEILAVAKGNLAACFGQHYNQQGRNPVLRLPDSPIRMIDRVTSVDPSGGVYGLGLITGEKTLHPDDWYFNCHFKDDYCMPGTLMSEGCVQLLQFYTLYIGLQTLTKDAAFQGIPGVTQTGRFRGQVLPTSGKLTYQIEISEIGMGAKPHIKADAYVIFEGRTISITNNIDIQLLEREN